MAELLSGLIVPRPDKVLFNWRRSRPHVTFAWSKQWQTQRS
jgi:hypothetical protein